MPTNSVGSLEQTYAEAKDCAARFRSAYLVYQPVKDKPDYFGIMAKGFFDRLKDHSNVRHVFEEIYKATVVIVSPPAP